MRYNFTTNTKNEISINFNSRLTQESVYGRQVPNKVKEKHSMVVTNGKTNLCTLFGVLYSSSAVFFVLERLQFTIQKEYVQLKPIEMYSKTDLFLYYNNTNIIGYFIVCV